MERYMNIQTVLGVLPTARAVVAAGKWVTGILPTESRHSFEKQGLSKPWPTSSLTHIIPPAPGSTSVSPLSHLLFHHKTAETKTCENFSNLMTKDNLSKSFQPLCEVKRVKANLCENTKLTASPWVTRCSGTQDWCQELWDPPLLLEYLKHTPLLCDIYNWRLLVSRGRKSLVSYT